MKQPQVELNFGTPPGTSQRTLQDLTYPIHNTQLHPGATTNTQHEETLPLHYMAEDTSARRRVARAPTSGAGGFLSGDGLEKEIQTRYDDEGKDVYSKQRFATGRVHSGRIHQPYSPPPTSIVRPPQHPPRQQHKLTTRRRPNSSSKTGNTSPRRYTPSSHAGRASTKSA